MKKRILFVCIHNSARSQMAEAFVNRLCPDAFEAESAGVEPGILNPLVVEVLSEEGIDIAGKPTRAALDVFGAGARFDYIVTVCDAASAERCPVYPGVAERLHWGLPDPSTFRGSTAEKLAKVREVREAIRAKVAALCTVYCQPTPA